MKLPILLLKKLIDLPQISNSELRILFDDLGLEVKDFEESKHGPLFTIETLANRADHVHVFGIARELSGRLLKPAKMPELFKSLPDKPCSVKVIKKTDLCMRYAALEIDLNSNLKAPEDSVKYLFDAAGNHPIVDILNYTALELGQPMHAFDKDKLEGDIFIDTLAAPEKIIALDEKEYLVPKDSIVIKDSKKIIAVAGVIGCKNSMVDEGTKHSVIESASFNPVSVRKTAKSMGISTDASYLFERGCDFNTVTIGLLRVLCLAGNGITALGYSLAEDKPTKADTVKVSCELIRRQLNLPVLDKGDFTKRLSLVGFNVKESDNFFGIEVPSWRIWDISNSSDIVEEYTKLFSLNKIKLELPPLDYEIPEDNNVDKLLFKVEPSLLGNGFLEVITKGFYSNEEVQLVSELDPALSQTHLSLKNSVDSAYSNLKVTNILHFAKIAGANFRKGVLTVKIYELCRLFSKDKIPGSVYDYEKDVLSFAFAGRWNDNEWQKQEDREKQLAAFKGVVESVIRSTGNQMSVSESHQKLLHPGVQASIIVNDKICGFFGLVHPILKEGTELKNDLFYCEIDVSELSSFIRINNYVDVSDLPAVRRDITLKIPLKWQADKIIHNIRKLNISDLKSLIICDNFKKSEEDFRRVTFRLTFQSDTQTLSSASVDDKISAILKDLSSQHGITIA